jgi:hypothetical protein
MLDRYILLKQKERGYEIKKEAIIFCFGVISRKANMANAVVIVWPDGKLFKLCTSAPVTKS